MNGWEPKGRGVDGSLSDAGGAVALHHGPNAHHPAGEAVARVMDTITSDDCQGYLNHCGYAM